MVCEKIFQSIFGQKIQNQKLGMVFSCFLIVGAGENGFFI